MSKWSSIVINMYKWWDTMVQNDVVLCMINLYDGTHVLCDVSIYFINYASAS